MCCISRERPTAAIGTLETCDVEVRLPHRLGQTETAAAGENVVDRPAQPDEVSRRYIEWADAGPAPHHGADHPPAVE